MDWYWPIACAALVAQLLVVFYAVNNYHYVAAKFRRKKPPFYRPRTTLIIPCKGMDDHFASNIRSFFEQDYESYHLLFVVEDESDPAFQELQKLLQAVEKDKPMEGKKVRTSEDRNAFSPSSCEVLVAGISQSSGQKIHNLLYAVDRVPPETEVLAFADADICVHGD